MTYKQRLDELSPAALQGLYPVERLKELGWWDAKGNTLRYGNTTVPARKPWDPSKPMTYEEALLETINCLGEWLDSTRDAYIRDAEPKTFWQRVKAVFVKPDGYLWRSWKSERDYWKVK